MIAVGWRWHSISSYSFTLNFPLPPKLGREMCTHFIMLWLRCFDFMFRFVLRILLLRLDEGQMDSKEAHDTKNEGSLLFCSTIDIFQFARSISSRSVVQFSFLKQKIFFGSQMLCALYSFFFASLRLVTNATKCNLFIIKCAHSVLNKHQHTIVLLFAVVHKLYEPPSICTLKDGKKHKTTVTHTLTHP